MWVNFVDIGKCNALRLDYRLRLWTPTLVSRAVSAVAELLVVNARTIFIVFSQYFGGLLFSIRTTS